MSSTHLRIRFTGYWSQYNCGLMPRRPGVFCVYRARFDDASKSTTMRELLYIGTSENVNQCVCDHDDTASWRACLEPDDVLSFSYGSVGASDLPRCEAALVRHHRPRLNHAPKGPYPYGYLSLTLHHRTPLLQRAFAVGMPPERSLAWHGVDLLRRGLGLFRVFNRLN
jgi:hypothetical protein